MAHDADTVGHGERLALVMGDVDERDAGALLDRAQLGAHVLAQLEVESGERLVEEHDGGLDGERAGDGDALLLAARELADHLVGGSGQVDELEKFVGAGATLGPVHAAHLEPEGDVVGHRHQRKEGEVLEDQRGGALVRADATHVLGTDPDGALGRVGEARNHPQDRRFTATRGSEKGEELARFDRDVHMVDGPERAEVADDIFQINPSTHRATPPTSPLLSRPFRSLVTCPHRSPGLFLPAGLRVAQAVGQLLTTT